MRKELSLCRVRSTDKGFTKKISMNNGRFVYAAVFSVAVIALLAGCMTSKKALQKGDYYQSCMLAIEKLRSNPAHKASIESLRQAYPLLLENTQSNINAILTLSPVDKYRQVYRNYVALNTVYQNIKACPGALNVIPEPTPFFDRQAGAQKLAFDECMTLAGAKMSLNDKYEARNAYYLYGEALTYKTDDPDAAARRKEALERGTIRVVINQIPVPYTYKLSCDFFYDELFTEINRRNDNIFVLFYRPDDARNKQLVPDQVVRMSFDDFVVGEMRETSRQEDCHRDSVEVGTVKNGRGDKVKVYNTVYARLTVRTRTVESNGLLGVRIVAYPVEQELSTRKFTGSFVWKDIWGRYTGDSRALSAKQLHLCEHDPVLPPQTQDLFVEFTKPIYTQLCDYLYGFYHSVR
jgi:hypothetical protein